jgi:hypothetical protein
MAIRLSPSQPSVTSAGGDLASSLAHLAGSTGRWLARQPAAQGVPVYAQRVRRSSADTLEGAGAWAGGKVTRARERGARAASATKTGVINLALVAVLLWWVDRTLTSDG